MLQDPVGAGARPFYPILKTSLRRALSSVWQAFQKYPSASCMPPALQPWAATQTLLPSSEDPGLSICFSPGTHKGCQELQMAEEQPSKETCTLNSRTREYGFLQGSRRFADVTTLMTFWWGGHSHIITMFLKTGKWEVEEELRATPCRKGSPSLPGTGGGGEGREPGELGATEGWDGREHCLASLEGTSLATLHFGPVRPT